MHSTSFSSNSPEHAISSAFTATPSSTPLTGATDRLGGPDYQRLMREAYDLGARRIQFLGGEPTLNKELKHLVEYAKTVGYQDIEIYSNLTTHVTPELLDYAVRMGVRFGTTFHSCDPVREDAFTAVKGSFQRKLRNVQQITARRIPIRGSVIDAKQPREDLEATVAFMKGDLGFVDVKVDRVRDFGRGRGVGNAAQLGELCGNCWRGSLAVAADGTAYACPFARDWPVGNVTTTPLSGILKSVALRSIRHRVFDEVTQRPPLAANCAPCAPGACSPATCAPCGPCNPSTCAPGCGPCSPSTCTPSG